MREIFQNIHNKQGTLTRVVLKSRWVGWGEVGLRCDLASSGRHSQSRAEALTSWTHTADSDGPSLSTYLASFLSSSCASCAPAQGGDLGVIHVDKPDNPTSPDGFRSQPLSPYSFLSSLSSYQRARILTLNVDLKVKVTQPHRL